MQSIFGKLLVFLCSVFKNKNFLTNENQSLSGDYYKDQLFLTLYQVQCRFNLSGQNEQNLIF